MASLIERKGLFPRRRSSLAKNPLHAAKAESYFLIGPVVMVYGLNLIGIQGKNTFIDRTIFLLKL